jgi:hypothetical protein
MEAGRVVLAKHCRESLYRSIHHVMPWKLNTPLFLFMELGLWFLCAIFRFLYYGTPKAFIRHVGLI